VFRGSRSRATLNLTPKIVTGRRSERAEDYLVQDESDKSGVAVVPFLRVVDFCLTDVNRSINAGFPRRDH